MKVFVKGTQDSFTLNKNNFVTSGGEGSIHIIKDTAFKIYNQGKKTISFDKINELSKLNKPYIINPQKVLLDSSSQPIGYTMRAVKHTDPLCKVFTKSFKEKSSIEPNDVLRLIQQMREGVDYIHSNNMLLVDINELNFLVNEKHDLVYFIDTDSYQTPSFPATAIMESIRDRHMKKGKFTQETDWFSWGIITFQMLIGVHPYKGKHSTYKDMDSRMINNISVLNSNVKIPRVCYSLDIIPQAYKEWYKAIFEDGKRLAPPKGLQEAIAIAKDVIVISGNDNFDIKVLERYESEILSCYNWSGKRVVLTKNKIFINKKGQSNKSYTKYKFSITPRMSNVIACVHEDGKIRLKDFTNNIALEEEYLADEVMNYNGRILYRKGGKVFEIHYHETNEKTKALTQIVANVLPQASKLYDGVLVQDILGSSYISVFPEVKEHRQVRIKEVEDHKIIDAKYDNNVLMIVGIKDGKYDRFVIRFEKGFKSYDVRVASNIVYSGLNFIVLDNGTCVHIDENEDITVNSNKKDYNKSVVIQDDMISSEIKLFKHGNDALFAKDNTLYKFSMKKR